MTFRRRNPPEGGAPDGYNSRSQRQTLTTPGGTDTYIHGASGQLQSEYYSGVWDADYVYLFGRPIARVYAEADTVVPVEPGIEPDYLMMSEGQEPGGSDTTIQTDFYIKWYHNDHLGAPQVITDKNANIRWSATYQPFGKLASEFVWQAENNVRFPGQYHDRSTDLYYNVYRHYCPDLGRYTTPDPIGLAGGTNLYGYAGQNPINNIDPMGLDWFMSQDGPIWYDYEADFIGPVGYNIGISFYGFNGFSVYYYGPNGAKKFITSAVAGELDSEGKTQPSKQWDPNVGPPPEGSYSICPDSVQYYDSLGWFDKALANVARGPWPGGTRAWGDTRVELMPHTVKGPDGVVRGHFFLHGGDNPGSRGCIDMTQGAAAFFKHFLGLEQNVTKIIIYYSR